MKERDRRVYEMHIQSVLNLAVKLLGITGISPLESSAFSNAITVCYFVTFIVSYGLNVVNLFYVDDFYKRIINVEGFFSISQVSLQ